MVPYWQKTVLVALILAIAVPTSTANRRRWRRSRDSNFGESEKYLRDLCSESENSDVCWNILKSSLRRFENSDDDRDIADGVIDLAKAKSKEIREKLNQWHRDSNDENLKRKYYLCSENYNDVDRDLEKALKNLGSDDHQKIWNQIEDSQGELDECKREFGPGSYDPAHVGDRNRELGVYLDVVRAAAERLEGYYRDDARHLH